MPDWEGVFVSGGWNGLAWLAGFGIWRVELFWEGNPFWGGRFLLVVSRGGAGSVKALRGPVTGFAAQAPLVSFTGRAPFW